MPRNNSKTRRAERRADAEARQAEWNSLNKFEKLERLADRAQAGSAEFEKIRQQPDGS